MKKIPSLFKRNYESDRLVYNEVVPGCEWVLQGEGKATIKWDGTSCLLRDNVLYKRYNRKQVKNSENFKDAPPGWIQASDPEGRHWPGWIPVNAEDPADRWHIEAFKNFILTTQILPGGINGTYELVGPKVQGNPYNMPKHRLIRHGKIKPIDKVPRDFEGIREWLSEHPLVEGLVWHHPDGRMAKIKRKDFGLEWPDK